MSFSLTWMPEVLLKAGLKVALTEGWEVRGHGDVGAIRGVLCHHTAGRRAGNMPSLNTLLKGRPGLEGPLAQLGLGRDGTYYVVAAGLAYHAGPGSWLGVTTGNTSFIGIEAENTGLADDQPWPSVQMDAYRRGVAALLTRLQLDADMCCGHKEYAPARKPDPSFDMDGFRADVRAIMRGTGVIRPPIPAVDDHQRMTLRRGDRGDPVREVQQKLGLETDGIFGPNTEAAVRRFQLGKGLVPDGIVGPKSWLAIAA